MVRITESVIQCQCVLVPAEITESLYQCCVSPAFSPSPSSHSFIFAPLITHYTHSLSASCGPSNQPIIRARPCSLMWLLKLASSLCESTSAMTHCVEPGSHDAQRRGGKKNPKSPLSSSLLSPPTFPLLSFPSYILYFNI